MFCEYFFVIVNRIRDISTHIVGCVEFKVTDFVCNLYTVKSLYFKLCGSVYSKLLINKYINGEERKRRSKLIFIHFSYVNTDNGGNYVNQFAFLASYF